jgi:hypothetical protein
MTPTTINAMPTKGSMTAKTIVTVASSLEVEESF